MDSKELNKYPSVFKRFLSGLIDGMVAISLISAAFTFNENAKSYLWVVVIIILAYEPLLTSKAFTLGQKLMGYRVRKSYKNEKLSYINSLFRYVLKIIFGLISLLVIPSSKHRRALHDTLTKSIAIAVSTKYQPIEVETEIEKIKPLTAEDKRKWIE